MDRYLVQQRLNGKWCNIKSYSEKNDAILAVKLSVCHLIASAENIRILDRLSKEYIMMQEDTKDGK